MYHRTPTRTLSCEQTRTHNDVCFGCVVFVVVVVVEPRNEDIPFGGVLIQTLTIAYYAFRFRISLPLHIHIDTMYIHVHKRAPNRRQSGRPLSLAAKRPHRIAEWCKG